ncbi:MAG: nucleotidyltransferase domain-containing protein [Bacteroidaceae bacterium]|nr:nucleotidyltransferase domain-containing protein [Bacteroidaceae bacterium]
MLFEKLKATAMRVVPPGGHVWLYGSRARGDEHEGSDWDLLILLEKENVEHDDFGKFAYPLEKEGWEYDAGITPIIYTNKEWKSRAFTPFYKQVERDKICIL